MRNLVCVGLVGTLRLGTAAALRMAVSGIRLLALLAVCISAGPVTAVHAHDVPADIRINAFAKPAGDRFQLLLRVPMQALLDVEFPTHGRDYLTISESEPALRSAIKIWLTDNIDVYEDGELLPSPEVLRPRVSLPSDRSFTSFDDGPRPSRRTAACRRP